jgi:hypothetical protein
LKIVEYRGTDINNDIIVDVVDKHGLGILDCIPETAMKTRTFIENELEKR